MNIRKFVVRAASLDELVALGALTAQAAAFLDAAVAAGLNVLVSGGTQAGKPATLQCTRSEVFVSDAPDASRVCRRLLHLI